MDTEEKMGYRTVTAEQLGLIWSQLVIGESNRAVARNLGLDRKTVNAYADKIKKLKILPGTNYGDALARLAELSIENAKEKPARAILEPLEAEITGLLTGDRATGVQPMKAKTAWIVIRDRHSLADTTSYESFKRFVRERALCHGRPSPTVRIEVEPGTELQVDYAKMGIWAVGTKNRVVYAFIATLSYSRQPFVLFGTSQNQVSFVTAIAAALAYYGGSPVRINLDNLKSGVIVADIYDPTLNRTFAELCDYYGIIADPARPAAPKDKGKVERIVQVVRELWKRLTALHPQATLDELNALARVWACEEYGRNIHGTTGVAPWIAFDGTERNCLQALPAQPFVPAAWTIASVHPDQFISVGKRYYGLPATLIGRKVAVRSTDTLVQIFFDHKLVRSFPITAKSRSYLPDDFPDFGQPFVPGAFASSLIIKAGNLGPQAASYLRLMLEDGGNLAIRRAQGCLSLLERYQSCPGFSHVVGHAIAHRVLSPASLRVLFDADAAQNTIPFPISPRGKAMGRDAGYYAGT
jgi:transposase